MRMEINRDLLVRWGRAALVVALVVEGAFLVRLQMKSDAPFESATPNRASEVEEEPPNLARRDASPRSMKREGNAPKSDGVTEKKKDRPKPGKSDPRKNETNKNGAGGPTLALTADSSTENYEEPSQGVDPEGTSGGTPDGGSEPPDGGGSEPPDGGSEPPDDGSSEPPDDGSSEPPDDGSSEPPDDGSEEPSGGGGGGGGSGGTSGGGSGGGGTEGGGSGGGGSSGGGGGG